MARLYGEEQDAAVRWGFLDEVSDPCCVVSPRMELVFMSAAARDLVPRAWFGCRCWQVFPVGPAACAARCPAVKAVAAGTEAIYCEETIRPPGVDPIVVGVAVVPLSRAAAGEKALLVLRPKPAQGGESGGADAAFREELLERGRALRDLSDWCIQDGDEALGESPGGDPCGSPCGSLGRAD
ncbi:MAG: PAS domain-containing protein [Planctomycetes bacterium]|nr:PAS domain-containing protein [Planctomycetota bacterium]